MIGSHQLMIVCILCRGCWVGACDLTSRLNTTPLQTVTPCDFLLGTTLWSSFILRTDSSMTLPTRIVQWINVIIAATIEWTLQYYGSFHDDLVSYIGTIASHNHTSHKEMIHLNIPYDPLHLHNHMSHMRQSSIGVHISSMSLRHSQSC